MTDADFVANLSNHATGPHLAALRRYAALPANVLLRLAVCAEAEGEADPGPEAVAWVLGVNRPMHPWWWGNSSLECILWPAQISSLWTDWSVRRAAIEAEITTPTWRLARAVERCLDAAAVGQLGADPTGGATYYWAPAACHPSWEPRVSITRKIGHHIFAVDESEVYR